MNAIRLAMSTSVVLVVALLSVTAASGKPPGPPTNVPCSQQALVDAINAANSAGGGTLNLAHGCDYQLTSSPDDSENGLPPITNSITINGNQATIDGTNSFRDFEVDGPGGNLSVRDLAITGGSVQDFGGGIANLGGAVTLDHSQVNGNSAAVAGGGIANAAFDPSSPATLTLRNSSVNDNQQTSNDPDTALGGGGIANVDSTVRLDHSQVNGNSAAGFIGGGIANGDFFGSGGQSMLTLDHSQVNGNSLDGFAGGGIATGDYIGSGGQSVLMVKHSQVNGNTAPHAGGGGIQNLLGSATIDHSQVDGNSSLNGGGIASGNQGGPGTAELKVSHSEVNGNTASAGPGGEGPPLAAGGIANGSEALIDHSRVDNNTTPNGIGAGIVNHAHMTISHSEVNRNAAQASGPAGSGGGIFNVQGPPGATPAAVLMIDHSKVNENSAGGNGGGIANGLALGHMSFPGGDITLTHSEVRRNTAAQGGGIFNSSGTVTLSDSKVTDNNPDNCEPPGTIAGCTN